VKIDIKSEVAPLLHDELRGYPAYCLSGVRHKDGMSLFQAFVWKTGTCRFDAKGVIQVEAPQEFEYRCEAQGRSNA